MNLRSNFGARVQTCKNDNIGMVISTSYNFINRQEKEYFASDLCFFHQVLK